MLCKKIAIIKDGAIIKLEDIDTLRKKQLKKREKKKGKDSSTLHRKSIR